MRLMRTLNNLFFTLGLAASIEATPYAYVTDPNDNIVVPINLATKTVGTPITGFDSPFYIVITNDGLTAYVGSEGTSVQSIAIPSNVVTNIRGTFNGAQCLAITPDNSTIYFANNFTSDTDLITPVSVATNQGQTPLNLPGYSPSAIAVNPLGNMAYIVVIDASSARSLVNMAIPSNTFGAFVTGFTDPNWITFTPDGTLAYVTDDDDNAVYIVDVASNTITGTVTGTFSNPRFIAIYGSTGYVVDDNGLTPVNLTTNTAGPTVSISLAIYMAITSDGTTGYLSSLFSGVYILDLTNNPPTILGEITSPDLNFPWAIALSEAQIFPPPSNLQGEKLTNQFLLQLDLINQITWSPPIGGPVPYAYKIYRDNLSSLIATVYAGTPLVFQDHKRQKGVPTTYYIVGLLQGGTTTPAASITF